MDASSTMIGIADRRLADARATAAALEARFDPPSPGFEEERAAELAAAERATRPVDARDVLRRDVTELVVDVRFGKRSGGPISNAELHRRLEAIRDAIYRLS